MRGSTREGRRAKFQLLCIALAVLAACRPEPRPPAEPRALAAPAKVHPSSTAKSRPESAEPIDAAGTAAALGNLPANEVRDPIEYTWLLKETRYTDARPALKPKGKREIVFYNGRVAWHDGCNSVSGEYQTSGEQLTINVDYMTLVGCPSTPHDVHYAHATRHAIQGRTLTLYTPAHTYVFTRFPYSVLSEHPWSLYSIVSLKDGFALQVDRFKYHYRQLSFEVDSDKTFRFFDLDGDKFNGSVKLSSDGRIRLALDAESQERLARKPREEHRMIDRTENNRVTEEVIPTTFAHLVEWSSVMAYRVFRDEIIVARPSVATVESEVLELYTGRYVYRFKSR